MSNTENQQIGFDSIPEHEEYSVKSDEKISKQNDNQEKDEDNKSIGDKESKPIKNSVQFKNNGSIDGFDNKCFEDDEKSEHFTYRAKFNNFGNKSAKSTDGRIIKTGYSEGLKQLLFTIICVNYLFYGFANNLLGATLPILKDNLNVDNQKILSSFTIRYLAFFIFNLLTIVSFKYARQYQYSLGIFFYIIVFFFVPTVKDYSIFIGLFAILGAGNVLLDSIPILLTVEMFQERSKFYSQVMFVFFAFGGFLGPLIAGQFVSSDQDIDANAMMNTSQPLEPNVDFNPAAQYYVIYNLFDVIFRLHNKTHTSHAFTIQYPPQNLTEVADEKETSKFYVPFYIISGLFTAILVVQMIIQCIFPYKKPKIIDKSKRASMRVEPYFPVEELPLTTEEDCENVKKADTKLPSYYKKSVILLFCIVLLCFNSIDQTLSLFLSTYLNRRTDLKLPVDLQSSFYSYLALTNTIGKLFSLVLIWYIPQKIYLFMNWTFILGGIVMTNFVTVDTIYLLKISLLLIGAGISSTYPLVFTLANKRVLITSKTQTIFLVAIVSQMLYLPIVFGNYIETNPKIFNVFLNAFALIAIITMVIFHLVDLKRTSFLKTSKPEVDA